VVAILQLSVIIPTRNRPKLLARILMTLTREIERYDLADRVEIVVVDDGSVPPVADALPDQSRTTGELALKMVRNSEQRGASAARNTGVDHSVGEVLVFIDDDIVPAEDYLRATIDVHHQHPEILVLNGNLRPLRDDVYSRFWFYYYASTFNRPGELYQVAMLASGNCSIKRSLLSSENPLFDPALLTREDFDLYLRLKDRGIPAYKSDRILAFNDCRDSLVGFITQRLRYSEGQRQLLAKYDSDLLNRESRLRRVPTNWRFLHLYLALRVAHRAVEVGARFRQIMRRWRVS
jgi:glycosyltransferase involved in cell wall biosynthesis